MFEFDQNLRPRRDGDRKGYEHTAFGLIVAISLAWVGASCHAPSPFADSGFIRLVDPTHREGARSEPASLWTSMPGRFRGVVDGAASLPRATIRDDTRYVLAAHPHRLLVAREEVDPVEVGIVSLNKPLGEYFPGARRLFIDAQVFVDRERRWRRIPPFVSEIRDEAGGRFVELRLEIADARPGSPVVVWVEAIRVPEPGVTRYSTTGIAIPEHTRLDFSIGILEAAAHQGPVRFTVEACEGDSCKPLFSEVVKAGGRRAPGWRSRSIELDDIAGKRRSLRFEAVPERTKGASLPVFANPILILDERSAVSRPNIILLSVDTLRRDHLEVYGYGRRTSPFMASKLAQRGVVFENLISEAATTDPSHMTLFTSLPALVHGISCCGSSLDVPVVTLAEAFRRQGFATAAFTEGGPLDHEAGFAIGFDRWRENRSVHDLLPSGQVKLVFEQARFWLENRDSRPFFLFLHTFQVHGPYTPEGKYRMLFGPQQGSKPGLEGLNYDREIRYVDDELAAFFGWLDERRLGNDTLFVILSDHGEEFYEHGSLGHATLPYEPVLNVPLIVVGPGITAGRRSAAPLQHVDIMPTLLDLAGVEVPEHVRGRSFAPLLRAESPFGEEGGRPRISMNWVLPDGFSAPAMTIRRNGLKLMRYRREGATEQRCFDLVKDPGEKRNVCAQRAGEVSELAHLLDRFEEEALLQRSALRGGDASPVLPVGRAPLDPDREAELRALGYVD